MSWWLRLTAWFRRQITTPDDATWYADGCAFAKEYLNEARDETDRAVRLEALQARTYGSDDAFDRGIIDTISTEPDCTLY